LPCSIPVPHLPHSQTAFVGNGLPTYDPPVRKRFIKAFMAAMLGASAWLAGLVPAHQWKGEGK